MRAASANTRALGLLDCDDDEAPMLPMNVRATTCGELGSCILLLLVLPPPPPLLDHIDELTKLYKVRPLFSDRLLSGCGGREVLRCKAGVLGFLVLAKGENKASFWRFEWNTAASSASKSQTAMIAKIGYSSQLFTICTVHEMRESQPILMRDMKAH